MTKRAIVYARVSTDDQAEKGFSLSAQVEAGRKYADAHGMTVASELIDDGVSGAMAFSERPAAAAAQALFRTGKAEALIVTNVDRLSRDVVDLLVTIRELLRAGIEVYCLDMGQVTSEYDIMLVIRGWQGSDEREKIKERSMRGKREKLARGMIVGGTAAFGYAHERDAQGRIVNLVINEDEAPVVRLIFQWYTIGEGETPPMTLYAIAMRMQNAGVRTRTRKAPWSVPMVSRILRNATYKGEYTYHCSDTDETFVVNVPAIVDSKTWEAAQVQKARNARKAKRNAKRDYLLTGIIKCECGRSMTGAGTQGRYYYACTSRTQYRKADRPCNFKCIPAPVIEAAAWDAVLHIVEHSESLEADLREAQRRELAEQEPKRAELETVKAMMAEAEAEAVTLAASLDTLEATRKGKERGIVGKVLQDRIDALEDRYNRLTARREELETVLANRRLTDEAISAALNFTDDVRLGMAGTKTTAEKRAYLDMLEARVVVTDGKPMLSYRLSSLNSIELPLH